MSTKNRIYQKTYSLELRIRVFFRTFSEVRHAKKINRQTVRDGQRYSDYRIGRKHWNDLTMADYMVQRRVARKLRNAGYVVTELSHATVRIYARAL